MLRVWSACFVLRGIGKVHSAKAERLSALGIRIKTHWNGKSEKLITNNFPYTKPSIENFYPLLATATCLGEARRA